jgi:CBS domain-containing protein
VKLRELMTSQVRTCRENAPLTEVAQIMAEVNCGAVPVVTGENRVAGIITDRDMVLRAIAHGEDVQRTTASACMTHPVTCAGPEMDAHEAANMMAQRQIRRLPVVEHDRLVGIVALGDMATINIHVNEAGDALSSISEPSRPGTH